MSKLKTSKDLQALWDLYLVTGWRHFGRMGAVCHMFFNEAGIKIKDRQVIQALVEIKRAPRIAQTLYMPVRAFIEAYLLPLSSTLWSEKYTDEEVIKQLKESPVDTKVTINTVIGRNATRRRHNERRTEKAKSTIPHILRKAQREFNRMSVHEYVKETASRKNRH